jgi:hypothetical protein
VELDTYTSPGVSTYSYPEELDTYYTYRQREDPGEMPTWPPPRERNRYAPNTNSNLLLLGASLGLNGALLIVLVSVIILVLGHSGLFSQGALFSGDKSAQPTATAAGSALSSPTVSLTPTAAPNWLQASPSSVQLCFGQPNQTVQLQNNGTDTVQWTANVTSPSSNNVAVNVSPMNDSLDPGASEPVQIQYQGHFNNSQVGQTGTIQFTPSTPNAGAGPILTYQIIACG